MAAVVVLLGLGLGFGLGCQKGVTIESSPGGSAAPTGGAPAASPAPSAKPTAGAPGLRSADVAMPASAAPPAGTAAGAPVAPTEPAAPAPAVAEPAHVTLPKSPATPVRRSTRPLARKQLERLAAFEFKDFERQARGTTAQATEFRHTTIARPKLGVTIRIDRCAAARDSRAGRARAGKRKPVAPDPRACTPMRLDLWKAKGDELKQFLSADLAARPDTRFEVGTRDLAGITVIYTYQFAHFFGKGDNDQPVGGYSDAYVLYYNDGVNRIQVIASYLDDVVDKERLLAVAPPEDLEKLAVAFASFYLHQWLHQWR